ncbi:hypothetical protein ATANTOWER_007671 [Ataeniobius toweri]|uniref:Uncharacterized protein n=1 Tax=Ataeniobius toweri TaxID=208326 RepID=A0ABU7AST2_9TELE|nr:hypothetical protein [Ataeniobius toweri]
MITTDYLSMIRELDGGGAAAHRQAEEQPLLPDQRAASEGLDMAGEAVALVIELSIDQDRISRCSAAPFLWRKLKIRMMASSPPNLKDLELITKDK